MRDCGRMLSSSLSFFKFAIYTSLSSFTTVAYEYRMFYRSCLLIDVYLKLSIVSVAPDLLPNQSKI